MIHRSHSAEDTKKFAAGIASRVLSRGKEKARATIITLQGDLGAGKTTFTQGFYKGLGIKRVPNSPTFILMRRSALSRKSFGQSGLKNVYHVDAYRIRAGRDMHVLGFGELLENPENLFLIEWPEKISEILPKKRISIRFTHGKKPEERSLRVSGI